MSSAKRPARPEALAEQPRHERTWNGLDAFLGSNKLEKLRNAWHTGGHKQDAASRAGCAHCSERGARHSL